ncbi:MAG: hypothetical protein EHM81_06405 [Chloroflexi bacterium]|nr:MAG: hypothetical protein EHM81_06405 [Chloroflexota bacterium]
MMMAELIFKRDLTLRAPLMNAAGTLGFAPDSRLAVPWGDFGAFVTNPLSLRPRTPATHPRLLDYPGGLLLHSGLPNPGFPAALKKYAPRWADADIPIIVNLMADRPEETARMVQQLETVENVMAVELGFAPGLADHIILRALEKSLGELPIIVSLPWSQVLALGPQAMRAGAMAISLAAPRGALPGSQDEGSQSLVTGRLYGPSIFPQALDVVRNAFRLGLPVIGGGGVYSRQNASDMLAAGARGVQVDAVLWRGDFA